MFDKIRQVYKRLLFHLLPKDIKQELKQGMEKDLAHLCELGLVENIEGLGAKITTTGRAYMIQERHLNNRGKDNA